jgi:regulator of replication initiation timing
LRVELSFDEDSFIVRAAASMHLLESRRVVNPEDGFNFDALCLAVCDEEEAQKWLGDKDEFNNLGQEFDKDDYSSSLQEVTQWKEALAIFDIDAAIIVRILCGLVLLGEVSFERAPPGIKCQGHENAAKALGIDVGQLSSVLTESGDVKIAEQVLQQTTEEMYRSLVMWILQKLNSKMIAEDSTPNGLSITIVDSPAFPCGYPEAGLEPPKGFQALQLQWLTEVTGCEMLQSCRKSDTMDLSRLHGFDRFSRFHDFVAGAGARSLTSVIRSLVSGQVPPSEEQVQRVMAAYKMQEGVLVKEVAGRLQCELSGWSSTVRHVLDLDFVNGAACGKLLPPKVARVLSQSSVKVVSESALAKGTMSIEDAQTTVDTIKDALQGRNQVRPWLVCCLRPNDKGSHKEVSQPVMLKQVRSLHLADLLHFCGDMKTYTLAWPLADFRKQFVWLMPTLDQNTDDVEVCRILVQSMASGQAIVGSETLYGSTELLKILDVKAKEKAGEAKAKDDLQSMDKNLRSQVQGIAQKQEEAVRQVEEMKTEAARLAKEQETARLAKDQKLAAGLSEPVTSRQDQKENANDNLQSKMPQHTAAPALLSTQAQHRLSHVGHRSGSPMPLRSESPASKMMNGTPWRSMALPQHATLHAALTQMSAVLRVAKESEAKLQRGHQSRYSEVEELRQEADAWRVESDRLWMQVKDLQQQLSWRPQSS